MLINCKLCKSEFKPKNRTQIFCSQLCSKKFHYNPDQIEKECLYCQKKFKTTNKKKLFCNSECAKQKRKMNCPNGYEWQNIREFILERDGFSCQKCKSDKLLHVHHVRPILFGGETKPNNLTTVCAKCHQNEHKKIYTLYSKNKLQKYFKNN
ncbi:MAG: HNH endonuclease [Leptospiraceae bacterium]|nr:HNH endonuclease [Leptospiraceae bacterium]